MKKILKENLNKLNKFYINKKMTILIKIYSKCQINWFKKITNFKENIILNDIYALYNNNDIKKNNNRNTKKIESNKKNENFKKDLINIPESFKDKIKESKN